MIGISMVIKKELGLFDCVKHCNDKISIKIDNKQCKKECFNKYKEWYQTLNSNSEDDDEEYKSER